MFGFTPKSLRWWSEKGPVDLPASYVKTIRDVRRAPMSESEPIGGLRSSSPRRSMYHVTVLSNFARGFDRYPRLYRKSAIPESTYANEFYVLPAELSEGGRREGDEAR